MCRAQLSYMCVCNCVHERLSKCVYDCEGHVTLCMRVCPTAEQEG